jgi:citrate synthase
MSDLQQKLAEKMPQWREEQQALLQQYRDKVISEVRLSQLMRGMRGVTAVICDTSYVDAQEGLLIRDIPLKSLLHLQPEEMFYLLCTGELPDKAALNSLQVALMERATVPAEVWKVLEALPEGLHPMTMLSIAMLTMRSHSHLDAAIAKGVDKQRHWEAMLEDALNVLARLPVIAAWIYRVALLKKPPIVQSRQKGITERYAEMLGFDYRDQRFCDFLRQFILVHSDHEGANASVLTSRVVHSTQSDLYYSLSGAMNCLAGPLHGLANQNSVLFVKDILETFSGVPQKDQLAKWVWQKLQHGKVIPGFGHAVLRDKDPRFVALFEFGKQYFGENDMFRVAEMLGEVVPELLLKQGKVKSPYPNIDGISGTMLYLFGLQQLPFYTVMFSVAQSIGICAQLILMRGMLTPIFRPKSITTQMLKKQLSNE